MVSILLLRSAACIDLFDCLFCCCCFVVVVVLLLLLFCCCLFCCCCFVVVCFVVVVVLLLLFCCCLFCCCLFCCCCFVVVVLLLLLFSSVTLFYIFSVPSRFFFFFFFLGFLETCLLLKVKQSNQKRLKIKGFVSKRIFYSIFNVQADFSQ